MISSSPDPLRTQPAPRHARSDAVRVFDLDPDLLAGIDAEAARVLRGRVAVRGLRVPCGDWAPPCAQGSDGTLGLLVLEGLVCRSICVHGRQCPELLGAGDLLRPWQPDAAMVEGAGDWRVLQPLTIAVLDERFMALVRRWPSIAVVLLERAMQRSRERSFQLAIAHIRQAETRLLALLWHLAERWGRVTAHGVALPLPLTHELLGQLACLHRPTTSTAVQRLIRCGELERRPDRGWTLLGRPPADDREHEHEHGDALAEAPVAA
jgi:CRP/FNR family cyclic AMP-dependent transcriptional regulator